MRNCEHTAMLWSSICVWVYFITTVRTIFWRCRHFCCCHCCFTAISMYFIWWRRWKRFLEICYLWWNKFVLLVCLCSHSKWWLGLWCAVLFPFSVLWVAAAATIAVADVAVVVIAVLLYVVSFFAVACSSLLSMRPPRSFSTRFLVHRI